MKWLKNTDINIIQKDRNIMKKIYNHFFSSKNNLYVIDNNNQIGLITYNSFITNITNIDKMIDYDICKIFVDADVDKENFKNDHILVINDSNEIICEYYKKQFDTLDIDNDRWDYLYKDNDKVIDYLRSQKMKKVIVLGSLKEKVFNYIKMYGNEFEVENDINNIEDYLKSVNEDCLIIDTDNSLIEFKKELIRSKNILSCVKDSNNILSLNELCNYSEYFYFINTLNNKIDIHVFYFPDIKEMENITYEEKLRIAFDHHYRYYYDRYRENKKIKNLLQMVLGDLFSDEFIESRNYMPNIILRNGRCFLEDSNNPYCSSYNGLRRTAYQNGDNSFNLNVFGPCMIFGALVDDENTIPSLLQKNINLLNFDYKVNNYGARAIDFAENIRTLGGITIKNNDQFVFVISPKEKEILEKMGYYDSISLLPVLNNPELKNYFIDEPVHCNHQANKKIAEFIQMKIEKNLLKISPENKEISQPLIVPKQQNVFKNNKYLNEYLEFLDQFSGFDGHVGCILMNCNPFTYGHYNLINFASEKVDRLYVFVVQENKSVFSFEDRFEMVRSGCEGFNNVIVIPSGKIFASSMLFPEYFNKEDNPEVSIDVSLDRELFTQYIAPKLNITTRFVGEENVDKVTHAFNKNLKENLPLYGIDVLEIPRFKDNQGNEISAKNVRKAMNEGNIEKLMELVPLTTLNIIEKKYMINKNNDDSNIKKKVN